MADDALFPEIDLDQMIFGPLDFEDVSNAPTTAVPSYWYACIDTEPDIKSLYDFSPMSAMTDYEFGTPQPAPIPAPYDSRGMYNPIEDTSSSAPFDLATDTSDPNPSVTISPSSPIPISRDVSTSLQPPFWATQLWEPSSPSVHRPHSPVRPSALSSPLTAAPTLRQRTPLYRESLSPEPLPQTSCYRSHSSHLMPVSPTGLQSGNPVQHTGDATSKEAPHLRQRCFNCCTTVPLSWRRSSLNPGKVVCTKCGLYERTHSRPRPVRFDNKAREQTKTISMTDAGKKISLAQTEQEPIAAISPSRFADEALNPRSSSTNIIPPEDDDPLLHRANSQIPDTPPNVHLFDNANNTILEDSTFNVAGRDINIIHGHHTSQIESEWAPFLSWLKLESLSKLFSSTRSRIFHAAEILKNVLERGFKTLPEIKLEEMTAEDALKYPPLNAKVLLGKTSLCIPGFLSQTLTSIRYSFF